MKLNFHKKGDYETTTRFGVAPIKPLTIPHRKLVAAVVEIELTTFVKQEIGLILNDVVF